MYCSVKNIPRWPGLAHFESILEVDFGDGKKWDDIAKVRININLEVLCHLITCSSLST